MFSEGGLSHAALLDRADRAIADAVAIRTQVRATLSAATQRLPFHPGVVDFRPSYPAPLGPLPPDHLLQPLWAWEQSASSEMVQAIVERLEQAWRAIELTMQTPSGFLKG